MSAVVFLLVCFLSCSVSEDPLIHVKIAHPGDDVILSCKAPNNVNITVVEWIRSNLEKRVYLKRDGHLNTAYQDPSYVNRVQLKDDEMKNGDLSLILKNVNNNDEGRYECLYAEETAEQIKPISFVYLDVKDPLIHVKIAHPGDDVILSCKAPNNVNITVVEWIRSNLEKRVYLKRDGHLNTAYQDPSYVNRVQLKDDEMKNGELSLILKNVNNNDEGTYMCRCKEIKGRSKRSVIGGKPISIVHLDVTGGDSRDGKDKHQHLEVILPVSLIHALVVVGGLVGLVIYKKRKGRSKKKPDLPVNDPHVL